MHYGPMSALSPGGRHGDTHLLWELMMLPQTIDGLAVFTKRGPSTRKGAGHGAFATIGFCRFEVAMEYLAHQVDLSAPGHPYAVRSGKWRGNGSSSPPPGKQGSLVNDARPHKEQVNVAMVFTADEGSKWEADEAHPKELNNGGEAPRIWWWALRDILPGEELFGDYGEQYWEELPSQKERRNASGGKDEKSPPRPEA